MEKPASPPTQKMVRKVVLFPAGLWTRLERYFEKSGSRLPELVRALSDEHLTAKGF